ncbi:hypothetical protein CYY_002555 [Polysphondylium violaceum]|uniref:DUSP domain-containing protein n=1 Tax=Polysphondylium violaceum TaxID=133409 RepID=A0A8J4PXX7_9MYCE|nr:hypothetical protein CYY_002555 [Polysphondylium violaceum]
MIFLGKPPFLNSSLFIKNKNNNNNNKQDIESTTTTATTASLCVSSFTTTNINHCNNSNSNYNNNNNNNNLINNIDMDQEEINKIIETINQSTLHVGEKWCLINTSWYSKWSKGIPASRLGPIDNGSLLNANGYIKPGLSQRYHYVIIPEQIWTILQDKYKGGPLISRNVIMDQNQQLILDLEIPFSIQIVKSTQVNNIITMNAFKHELISTFKERSCKYLNIVPDNVRLWDYHCYNKNSELNENQMISLSGVFENQLILFEEKIGGIWPAKYHNYTYQLGSSSGSTPPGSLYNSVGCSPHSPIQNGASEEIHVEAASVSEESNSSSPLSTNTKRESSLEVATGLQHLHFTYPSDFIIDKELQCSYCMKPLYDPVIEPNCRTMFCRGCLSSSIKNTGCCSSCNLSTALESVYIPPKFITNYLDEIMVKCSVCKSDDLIKRAEIESHLENDCKTKCKSGCQVLLNSVGHLSHDCPSRAVACKASVPSSDSSYINGSQPLCKWTGPLQDKEAHESSCQYVTLVPVISMIQSKYESLESQFAQLRDQVETLKHDKRTLESMILSDYKICVDCSFIACTKTKHSTGHLQHLSTNNTNHNMKQCKIFYPHSVNTIVTKSVCSTCFVENCQLHHNSTRNEKVRISCSLCDCFVYTTKSSTKKESTFLTQYPFCKNEHRYRPLQNIDSLINSNKQTNR